MERKSGGAACFHIYKVDAALPEANGPCPALPTRLMGLHLGAISPANCMATSLILPWCDTQATNAHTPGSGAAIYPGTHTVLIVDQAGWHKPALGRPAPKGVLTAEAPTATG